jgi:hypothetical protein
MTNMPLEFADLERYYPQWCPPTERGRAEKRVSTDLVALREFQSELAPRMETIIQFLNTQPNDPDALSREVKHLYWLAQMVMEASVPIDLQWKTSDIEDVFPLERMTFVSGVIGRVAS